MTTGETAETTAGTVATEPTRRKRSAWFGSDLDGIAGADGRLFEVAGLPYPPSGVNADLDSYGAVQLFQDRAQLALPDLPTVADAKGVARLCRQLAGVPLGIELAARLARSASPTAIADQLARGLDLLATNAPDVERRHQSVRSVIDWSWQLLTEPERHLLGRLSVLRGSFDLTAAEAIADATLPLMASLVDASLVEVSADDRYGMHEFLPGVCRRAAGERSN